MQPLALERKEGGLEWRWTQLLALQSTAWAQVMVLESTRVGCGRQQTQAFQ